MWQIKALAALILFYLLFTAEAQQQCSPLEYILSSENQLINITSPNYPNYYQPGSTCRYRITAPTGFVVVLTCLYEIQPNTCDTDHFLISLDGDYQFRDAERYCRSTQITRVSNFRSIGVAYVSTWAGTRQRGRFFCQAYARRQSCNCGWTLNTRISNGQEAMRNEFPSIVALRDINSPQRLFCGGNIISPRHILTAAHCMQTQSNPARIMAYVGDHDLTVDTDSIFQAQYRIQSVRVHPAYSSASAAVNNDIAILTTAIPMEWSRGVGPVCLPWRQQTEQFAYRTVDVAGWGTLGFAGSKSNTLQKVQLMILDNGVCQQQYNGSISNSQICTYDSRGLGQDSCQYDSGGPVILRQQRMTLLGIISFGRSCGLRYSIGVNTRITAHLGWIWSYTQNDVCVL